MHRKIRCALTALALVVACQAMLWPRKPLFAADKPKPDPVRNQRLKAAERFGAVRTWTLVCTMRADDNDYTWTEKPKLNAPLTFRVSRRYSVVARIDLTRFIQGTDYFEWRGDGNVHVDAYYEHHIEDAKGWGFTITQGTGSTKTEGRLYIDRKTGRYRFNVSLDEPVRAACHAEAASITPLCH